MESCMAGVWEYIMREDTIDPLTKAALLHYQIEAIHPFESGNGRIGRIVIAHYLYETGLLKSTLLPISELLLMDKVEYFDRLDAVHYHGRYEQWIKFFIRVLETAADTALRCVESAITLRDRYISSIKNENKDVDYLINAYEQAEKHIFLSAGLRRPRRCGCGCGKSV